MATKNHPGVYDCYGHAHPDEPMFVLLGRDPMAPVLVSEWAKMRKKRNEDPKKVAEALQCVDAMVRWAIGLGKSVPAMTDTEVSLIQSLQHATQLDQNWASVHEAATGAIRKALRMPDGTIPDLVTEIERLRKIESTVQDALKTPASQLMDPDSDALFDCLGKLHKAVQPIPAPIVPPTEEEPTAS
jgi:hypothetical protein